MSDVNVEKRDREQAVTALGLSHAVEGHARLPAFIAGEYIYDKRDSLTLISEAIAAARAEGYAAGVKAEQARLRNCAHDEQFVFAYGSREHCGHCGAFREAAGLVEGRPAFYGWVMPGLFDVEASDVSEG
jgi:hypothetical protein